MRIGAYVCFVFLFLLLIPTAAKADAKEHKGWDLLLQAIEKEDAGNTEIAKVQRGKEKVFIPFFLSRAVYFKRAMQFLEAYTGQVKKHCIDGWEGSSGKSHQLFYELLQEFEETVTQIEETEKGLLWTVDRPKVSQLGAIIEKYLDRKESIRDEKNLFIKNDSLLVEAVAYMAAQVGAPWHYNAPFDSQWKNRLQTLTYGLHSEQTCHFSPEIDTRGPLLLMKKMFLSKDREGKKRLENIPFLKPNECAYVHIPAKERSGIRKGGKMIIYFESHYKPIVKILQHDAKKESLWTKVCAPKHSKNGRYFLSYLDNIADTLGNTAEYHSVNLPLFRVKNSKPDQNSPELDRRRKVFFSYDGKTLSNDNVFMGGSTFYIHLPIRDEGGEIKDPGELEIEVPYSENRTLRAWKFDQSEAIFKISLPPQVESETYTIKILRGLSDHGGNKTIEHIHLPFIVRNPIEIKAKTTMKPLGFFADAAGKTKFKKEDFKPGATAYFRYELKDPTGILKPGGLAIHGVRYSYFAASLKGNIATVKLRLPTLPSKYDKLLVEDVENKNWNSSKFWLSAKDFGFTIHAKTPNLVPELQELEEVEFEAIKRNLKALDHNNYEKRDQAQNTLRAYGYVIELHLRKALKDHPSEELKQRLFQLLNRIKQEEFPKPF